MELEELEHTLEAALAVTRPTTRDVRDALVDFYMTAARPFVVRGLSHTHPGAEEAVIRRVLALRLPALWRQLRSPWEEPTLDDLARFRQRIENYACVVRDERFNRTRRLLDSLMLGAAVANRLESVRQRKATRRLKVVEGGGELSPPRGHLRLVREAPEPAAPTGSLEQPRG